MTKIIAIIYNTEADAPLESELPIPTCAEKVTLNLRAQSNIVALIITTIIAVGVIVIALGITIFLVAYCTYKRIRTVECLNIHSTNTAINELQYNSNACYGLGQSNLVTRETNIHTKNKFMIMILSTVSLMNNTSTRSFIGIQHIMRMILRNN